MLNRFGTLIAVFVVSALPACGSSEAAVDINRSDKVPVALDIALSDDLSVSVKETVESHFVLRRTSSKDSDERKAQVLGVEPTKPMMVGSAALLAGTALVAFEGDGTYEIPVGSPMDLINATRGPGGQPDVTSSIKVDWWPNGQIEGAPETFMRRAKPCKAVIKKGGLQGTVTCPDLTNEAQDKHFTVKISWTAPASSSSG